MPQHRRYGLDPVYFWPRLLLVIPVSTRAILANAKASMDLMVVT
ncbi:hypothetical protein [Amycolatopsis sp. NPDC049868]